MAASKQDIKAIAPQLLAGMLANPHIYASISDTADKGQKERILVSNAVMMAQNLVEKIEQSNGE